MKRLLVLFLVMGLAAAAQAGVIDMVQGEHIDVNGNGEIDESDIILIKIVSTVPLDAYDFDVHVSGPGTLMEVDGGPGAVNVVFPLNRQDNFYGGNGLWLYKDTAGNPIVADAEGVIPNIGQMSDAYNSTDPTQGFIPGDLVWGLAIHCDGPGDVIVDLTQGPGATGKGDIRYGDNDYGDLIIEQVPEPMTLSLLGLGGLALIRRRRS